MHSSTISDSGLLTWLDTVTDSCLVSSWIWRRQRCGYTQPGNKMTLEQVFISCSFSFIQNKFSNFYMINENQSAGLFYLTAPCSDNCINTTFPRMLEGFGFDYQSLNFMSSDSTVFSWRYDLSYSHSIGS